VQELENKAEKGSKEGKVYILTWRGYGEYICSGIEGS
jgi:hypothetical protein